MTVPMHHNVTARPVPRRRTASPLSTIDQSFHAFLFNWCQAKDAGTLRDQAKGLIKRWFKDGGDASHEVTVNENGSQLVEFDTPLTIGGRTFAGIENVRTETPHIDPDLVDEWLDSLPKDQREKLAKRLLKREVTYVLDIGELYVLNQEGEIDDKVLDSFTTVDIGWSLNVRLA